MGLRIATNTQALAAQRYLMLITKSKISLSNTWLQVPVSIDLATTPLVSPSAKN